ncbi:YjeF-related protein [Thalassoporum mexicanum PCC 7367]|uniref:bifunctional ADP-dependent NAD(P)H-hydrate dehydratase/NAD(P)H-hydrate epimerase n=1 Tax=Thalassoporum mexicanum TaxID=3457544 RepID=UPI00029FC5D0|nr:bifunctional ADP-dependent NAD(P)H-hydrate dehydratase/NAD(P)H-hydrate epimerase [Pseudanabaena sp. PCC 7367]AFY70158.1 YjeF-related protein [Pseudanabaena sp. PCC 7367]
MLDQIIVTTAQMRSIEELMFRAGMPVAALMEKVAGQIVDRIEALYPVADYAKVGILVGPGHNGGDALVVARELWHRDRQVRIFLPLPDKLKPLTREHCQYAHNLGIPILPLDKLDQLKTCDLIVDGLFGFGLEREITEPIATAINTINTWQVPILSIDLPSGLNTDHGKIMGTAIKASHTLCLGLWKRGLFTESALVNLGELERVDFDIPTAFVVKVLGKDHNLWRINCTQALDWLPRCRPLNSHKYQTGHLLLIAGSQHYPGAAILAALGARASGVGMLTILVPESLRQFVLAQVPEALVIGCPETETGAIAELPFQDVSKYSVIACGPGLTVDAQNAVEQVIGKECPLVLDADGLNLLVLIGVNKFKRIRPRPTIITPHWGEFGRLFPHLKNQQDRLAALREAIDITGAIVLLKGARTAIGFNTGNPVSAQSIADGEKQNAQIWINPESTPALARGGSGDVLTGLIGGLWAQGMQGNQAAIAATIWHSQAAIQLAKQHTQMSVEPSKLANQLGSVLAGLAQE